MSQSQGTRECCGQRGLPGAQHQGGGGRTFGSSLQWSFPLSRMPCSPLWCPSGHWNRSPCASCGSISRQAGPEGGRTALDTKDLGPLSVSGQTDFTSRFSTLQNGNNADHMS